MRRVPQQHANSPIKRERDRRAFTRQWVLLACCVVLAAGFIFAARQQIAAVQYGYKSEELRRRRDLLLEEQRRLLLDIEEKSSPATLEQHARELGLQPARASQIGAESAPSESMPESTLADSEQSLREKEELKDSLQRPGSERAVRPAFAGSAAATLSRR